MIHTLDLRFLGHDDTIAAFVVETSVGPVLVESGPHSTIKQLDAALAASNYKRSDIKHVLLSHIHFDHAGAAWCFAEHGATIYVHPFGAKHMIAPSKLYNSAKQIYGDRMEYLWGKMEAIAEQFIYSPSHGEVITIGDKQFTAWHTPGHAVHHIAWQCDDVLFAGDVAGVKIEGGIVVPPCPPPDINIEDWQQSINLIKSLRIKYLYLTHFGVVDDVDAHLSELEGRLLAWANWIKPYFERGAKAEEIVTLFEVYANAELIESGVSELDIPKYQGANPPFMSVAGLMRYWYKKSQVV